MSRDKSAEIKEDTVLHDYEGDLAQESGGGGVNEKNHCHLVQKITPPRHDEGCRTPTSELHKIPATISCPRTPRKRTRLTLENRKLRFFEDSGRDEVDLFFRTSFDDLAKAPKRRCLSV